VRRILIGDIAAVLAELKTVPPEKQRIKLEDLFYRAHCADKFRKRTGRVLLGFGDGTLQGACCVTGDIEQFGFDRIYDLERLALVLSEIVRRKRRNDF
jgi:hypothetical protein